MKVKVHKIAIAFGVLCFCISSLAADHAVSKNWNDVPTPFRPVNITAVGNTIWVCGADEMILASTDGGATWETKHQNRDGEVLLSIAFVDEKIGHAAGTGGLLLSTADGGQTWKSHTLGATVRNFSFADAANGIAVVSSHVRQTTNGLLDQVQGAASTNGTVGMTHDGGDHWENVRWADEGLQPFSEILSVVALDASHALIALHQPEGEDMYAVSQDAGKTWKPAHPDNVFAGAVFRHAGEYWAFGIEYLDRKNHGGYSAPVGLHSKDGVTWMHGIRGPNEFSSCNVQGCYLWDGTLEELYGKREKFWALPQGDSLTEKWALAGNTVCTVSSTLKCASAVTTDKPQPRPERNGIISISTSSGSFAGDCLQCSVRPIIPDNPDLNGRARIVASVTVRRDGSVAAVSLDRAPSKLLNDAIVGQLSEWLFEPARKDVATDELRKDILMEMWCHSFPGRPETASCILVSSDELSRSGLMKSGPSTENH